jgi:organic hydroperoxide reductase OsmC/OhrA
MLVERRAAANGERRDPGRGFLPTTGAARRGKPGLRGNRTLVRPGHDDPFAIRGESSERKEACMSLIKSHRYVVRTYPLSDGKLALESPFKPDLEVATPPEYKDGVRGAWSSEELLIGALATCFELTARAVAKRKDLPIHEFRTEATGHVQTKDGLLHFVAIELDVQMQTDAGRERDAELIATLAEEQCVVAGALDVPIRLIVEVDAVDREPATA